MDAAAQHITVVALQRVAARQARIASGLDGQLHGLDGVAADQVLDLPGMPRIEMSLSLAPPLTVFWISTTSPPVTVARMVVLFKVVTQPSAQLPDELGAADELDEATGTAPNTSISKIE